MKGRGRDKRGPPDAEDTTASRQNAPGRVALVATGTPADTAHGRVALVATGTPADTAHGRVALVATGKGYGRDKRGPPEHALPSAALPRAAPPNTASRARPDIWYNMQNFGSQ